MNRRDDIMVHLLTQYRAIPTMYRALTGNGPVFFKAAKELASVFQIKPEEVEPFLEPYREQIIYAMQDFRHYVNLIGDIPTFEEAYWPAMDEESKLVKNSAPFKIPWENPVILDIGAGSMPYLKLFQEVNLGIGCYIAVDKRYETHKPPVNSTDTTVVTIASDYAPMFPISKENTIINVLFLANFLHCLEDIDAFFDLVLPSLPSLKIIKILEIKPDWNLDFLFDYHMYEHCKGQRFNLKSAIDVAELTNGTLAVQSLGDFHNMYTIEL